MNKESLEKIKEKTDHLLTQLEVPFSTEVNFNKETNTIEIQINSEEPSLLIGYHGETLLSLQIILSFIVHKLTNQWFKVLVNVNDYRQKKEEQLKNLALNLATKVKFSQQPESIYHLSPSERRIIHLALSNHPDVTTVSEGEGQERHIVIKPKATV